MVIEELYKRYKGHIFLVCRRYIKDPADTQDVVQIVFVKAWRSIGRFENRSEYYTWLYRIAVNECLNYLKKNRYTSVSFDETKWLAVRTGCCLVKKSSICGAVFWRRLTGKRERLSFFMPLKV